MDKNSKVLLVILVVLLVVSISFAYYRFFISSDYSVIESEEE